MNHLFRCGPVTFYLTAQRADLLAMAAAELDLYAGAEAGDGQAIDVHIQVSPDGAPMGAGSFLRSRSMHVDRTATGLQATCRSGAAGTYDAGAQRWDLYLPVRVVAGNAEQGEETNLEDLLELVLTTSWRQAGWVPLHAGAVAGEGRCAILAAPSRGGKTTLSAALLHLGWLTMGDDKLLIGLDADGGVELRSLQRHFNIHPQTRQWFPEIGDLSHLPLDSMWTPKRRVAVDSIWPDRYVNEARATHLVQIHRHPDHRPTRFQRLGPTAVLSALLHQTVVPSDAASVRSILAVMAPAARRLQGLLLEVGEDAYSDGQTFRVLDEMLA